MLKGEPSVERRSLPVAGALNEYQTDAPPGLAATAGSPASLVAPLLPPVTEPLVPVRPIAVANESLGSGVNRLALIGSAQPPLTCMAAPDGAPEYSVAAGRVASVKSTWPLDPGNRSAAEPPYP